MLAAENRELFAENAIGVWFANRRGHIRRAIAGLPQEKLTEAALSPLGEALFERYRHSPLAIEVGDRTTIDPRAIQIPSREGGVGSPGIAVAVSVPYVGDTSLWNVRPRARGATPPRGIVRPESDRAGRIEIAIECPRDVPQARIAAVFEEEFDRIAEFVDRQRRDVEVENRVLVSFIANALRERVDGSAP